jgi:hypothetical protein
MGHVEICYRFTQKDGTVDTIDLKLDPTTLELIDNVPEDLPAWSELGFHQCQNCPLSKEKCAHCPAAANLVNLVQGFARVLSHEWVATEVTTAERTYAQETPAQRSVSSLMGLIMAVSGCPLTAYFRPMARFHIPWASQEETIYRATSMYLLAQYLRKRDGMAGDLELDGLSKIYEDIRTVNRAFIERLRAASEEDSTINAIVVLDTQALTMPWAIDSSLEELRPGFEPYLKKGNTYQAIP